MPIGTIMVKSSFIFEENYGELLRNVNSCHFGLSIYSAYKSLPFPNIRENNMHLRYIYM